MKRLVSLLLAVIMVMGLVACGKSGGTSSSTPAGNSSTSTSAGNSSTSEPAKEPPKKLTIGLAESANVTDYDNNAFTKFMEEKLNIDIEFQRFASLKADRNNQLATQVAGGDKLPDILFGFSLDAKVRDTYGDDGYLVDLAPYFDDPNWEVTKEFNWHQKLINALGADQAYGILSTGRTFEGAMYGWPGGAPSLTDKANNHVYINEVWLQKLGLEIPKSWDEMVTVLTAFKTQDPNGNGKADEIPMMGGWNPSKVYCGDIVSWLLNCFEFINDTYFFNVTDDGQVYSPYITDEYRNGLKAVTKLVEDGLLSPMFWTVNSKAEMVPFWTPPDRIAICGMIAGYAKNHCEKGNPVILEYAAQPPLTESNQWIPVRAQGTGGGSSYITTDCEDFTTAARFLASFCEMDVMLACRYGEQDVDWTLMESKNGGMTRYQINDLSASPNAQTWAVNGPFVGYYSGGTAKRSLLTSETSVQEAEYEAQKGETLLEMANGRIGGTLGMTIKANIAYAEANQPKNIFYKVIYSPEEEEINGTKITDIKAYMRQMRGLFCTGVKDINSDADWKEYVDTMNGMGLQDVVKTSHDAWTRLANTGGLNVIDNNYDTGYDINVGVPGYISYKDWDAYKKTDEYTAWDKKMDEWYLEQRDAKRGA